MYKNKATIIHVIDSLGRGGAETMLVSLLKEMEVEYNIILVTLMDLNEFSEEEIICSKIYSLNYRSIYDISKSVLILKRIIKTHRPLLVRSQLFWSTIIARLACPKNIKFVFSIHSQLSLDSFSKNKWSFWLEKLTYKKRHSIIAVSEVALKDYQNIIKVSGKKFIIYNFVDYKFFNKNYYFNWNESDPIKLVAVGNLKDAKNFFFLLNVIRNICKEVAVTLDIIGEGYLREDLQNLIDKNQLPVKLLGMKKNVDELLPNYTAFVMCSKHEGFGNAPVEAMAIGLPLILNDLEVMKEMSKQNAIFFESDNVESLSAILKNFNNYIPRLEQFSMSGKKLAQENHSRGKYFVQLKNIYNDIIKGD